MIFVFGDHRLDIARRELRRGVEPVEIPPKVFDLLAYLVQQRDHVVSKDDLIGQVWGGRFVSDAAITTRLNAVRRAIGDNGAEQRLVRTFTGKGIRFIAEVAEMPGETVAREGEISIKPSIAVLPFTNMSGDPEQEYFADGIVEEITTAIARYPGLLVIARNSAFAYKGKAIDVRQVARELGVRYALEGSVRKSGNWVRITGQLIDTTTAAHIWVDRFDGALDDVFELQDRVASSVAAAIEPKLRFAEIARAYSKPTDSLDAYDLYLRAVAEGTKRTKESTEASVGFARKALELDPDYAPAMARLAQSLSMQRVRGWIALAGPAVEEGIRMARRAIAIAGDNQWTLMFAGVALANFDLTQIDAALAALDRAVAMNPSFALAVANRALVLSYRSEHADEAVRSAERALSLSLSPFDPAMFAALIALAIAHLAAGRYEVALPWAVKAKYANGGLPAFRFQLSLYGHLGRQREASDCLQELRDIMPEPTVAALLSGLNLSPEILARLVEGWRRAGIPED